MNRFACLLPTCVALLSACAPHAPAAAPTPPVPAPAAIDPGPADSLRPRHAVRPVRITDAFAAAVRRGTRTTDGRPGDAYWQNRVAYRISAELDPASARIDARETVRYHNASPDTLREVVFHLYQNVFAQGAQRTRRVPITGGMRIGRLVVDGITARPDPRPARAAYRIEGTLMRVTLPYALAPDGEVTFEIEWSFAVPPAGAPRTGHADGAFVVAQWYPQIARYDDLRGWHDRPYWSNGEFHLEYADFDVDLTVPEGWLVTATGSLENPLDVLGAETAAKLARARASDDVVSVVSADDIDARRATARDMGGMLTWHFTATRVRDFAFATSDRYLWDAVRADSAAGAPLISAFYRPGAPHWEDAADYMRDAVQRHARLLVPYPWPHLSAAEGPIGGMEYPMLVFIGTPERAPDLYAVLSHEIAHQWWPMMVGSNETDHAWQDEGLATFAEDRTVAARFSDEHPFDATRDAYLAIAGTDAEVPVERPADLYGPGPQYGVATYRKPAALLRALEVVLGEAALDTALRAYTERWAFRHPAPFDFFNTVEDVAGRDLDWFWSPWWFDTVTLDHALVAVDVVDLPDGGERATITVQDQGGAPMPVPIRITLADGTTRAVLLPVEPWLEGATLQRATLDAPSPVVRAEIDPDRRLPDTDRRDNQWRRPGS